MNLYSDLQNLVTDGSFWRSFFKRAHQTLPHHGPVSFLLFPTTPPLDPVKLQGTNLVTQKYDCTIFIAYRHPHLSNELCSLYSAFCRQFPFNILLTTLCIPLEVAFKFPAPWLIAFFLGTSYPFCHLIRVYSQHPGISPH